MTAKTDALDACPQCGSQKRTLQLSYFTNQALKLGPTVCHHLWHDGNDSAPEPGAPTPTRLSNVAAQRLVAEMIEFLEKGGWNSETDEIDDRISDWLMNAQYPKEADRIAAERPSVAAPTTMLEVLRETGAAIQSLDLESDYYIHSKYHKDRLDKCLRLISSILDAATEAADVAAPKDEAVAQQ